MKHLHFYTRTAIDSLIAKRDGETKFGECVQALNSTNNLSEELKNSSVKFVLFGVPEDIGVRMNGGNGGAQNAWKAALKSVCNIQENNYNKGNDLLILGHLDFSSELKNIALTDINFKEKGDQLVRLIDKELSALIKLIVGAGKIPIIIGGGHNNSYGNIKGSFEAFEEKINVINLDAHTDFRKLEERHSGNGFSYAYNNSFLDKYYMFGIHENYTPKTIFDTIDANPDLQYNTFEELEVYNTKDFTIELKKALDFVSNTNFGIEIDLDAIESFPSSAMTPSGFSTKQARQFTSFFGQHKNVCYLHICEASPDVVNDKTPANQVGKFISYLISDFMKAKN
ncbi:arginase [Tenacibaculum todarodis]|uniref:Arginase n=1 Tax=Tenacibaculum todarodis TaxID=1850252 RepID=A0A1L3JMM0_9FLAO|nr:formimidoylglutamase [Tenacibaculum todarodis]APG66371.1 arginase [Tenacibaculum todarodis]